MFSAISLIATLTRSGNAVAPTGWIWLLFFTAVPLLSEFLAERPTPTTRQVSSGGPPPQVLRDPGQPPSLGPPRRGAECLSTRCALNSPQAWRQRPEVCLQRPHRTINGRLEAHYAATPSDFRNLTHYRWRSLLHRGALHHAIDAL